eukprot:scaffold45541_cov49-Attheya_sp.AAC.6
MRQKKRGAHQVVMDDNVDFLLEQNYPNSCSRVSFGISDMFSRYCPFLLSENGMGGYIVKMEK